MEHAIEHLRMQTEKDRGFAVLHADNAVELMLKEIARSKGIRVINKKGYSLDYYECIDQLVQSGLKIPELSSIDLLHTERNNTYHLGSKPDESKTEWLVYDVALSFIRRVCREELDYDVNTFSKEFKLTAEAEQDIELTRSQMVNQYLNDATIALKMGMFESTVMMSYMGIEALLRNYVDAKFASSHQMMKTLTEDRIFSTNLLNRFEELRQTRNSVAHGLARTDEKVAKFALEVFREVIDEIGLPLELKCKTCGVQFDSAIVMNRKTFESVVLKANKHKCPNGHVHSYDQEDYILKL